MDKKPEGPSNTIINTTMKKPFPALCRNCRWSEEREEPYIRLYCTHPKVNAKNSWALASVKPHPGTECSQERERKGWFAACGMIGKLWEYKP